MHFAGRAFPANCLDSPATVPNLPAILQWYHMVCGLPKTETLPLTAIRGRLEYMHSIHAVLLHMSRTSHHVQDWATDTAHPHGGQAGQNTTTQTLDALRAGRQPGAGLVPAGRMHSNRISHCEATGQPHCLPHPQPVHPTEGRSPPSAHLLGALSWNPGGPTRPSRTYPRGTTPPRQAPKE